MVAKMGSQTVGVLALQGAFAKHAEILRTLNATSYLVRYPEDLDKCDALIIPGGESTTISKRVDDIGLRDPLISFAHEKPVFGTCAGLIMMAKESNDSLITTFGILDVEVVRNGYGTQYDSFLAEIDYIEGGKEAPFQGVFIRAPRIKSIGPNVKVIAHLKGEPILIQQGHHLGAVFHPELTGDPRIHAFFLKLAAN